jgi:hypothetical protein
VRPGLHTGADDGQLGSVGAGQQFGGDRGYRRGADLRHRGGIQQRHRLASLRAGQQDDPLVGIQAAGRVAGDDADRLQRIGTVLAAQVGGHQAHQARRALRLEHGAQRLIRFAAGQRGQRGPHRIRALGGRQQVVYGRGGQHQQLHGPL